MLLFTFSGPCIPTISKISFPRVIFFFSFFFCWVRLHSPESQGRERWHAWGHLVLLGPCSGSCTCSKRQDPSPKLLPKSGAPSKPPRRHWANQPYHLAHGLGKKGHCCIASMQDTSSAVWEQELSVSWGILKLSPCDLNDQPQGLMLPTRMKDRVKTVGSPMNSSLNFFLPSAQEERNWYTQVAASPPENSLLQTFFDLLCDFGLKQRKGISPQPNNRRNPFWQL